MVNSDLEGLGKMYNGKNLLMALLKNVAPMRVMKTVMRFAAGRIDLNQTSDDEYVRTRLCPLEKD